MKEVAANCEIAIHRQQWRKFFSLLLRLIMRASVCVWSGPGNAGDVATCAALPSLPTKSGQDLLATVVRVARQWYLLQTLAERAREIASSVEAKSHKFSKFGTYGRMTAEMPEPFLVA